MLIVPAFPALYGPIDRNLGHFRRYTIALSARIGRCGWLAREKGTLHERFWLFRLVGQSHIFSGAKHSPEGQIEFFDRYIVPLVSRDRSDCATSFWPVDFCGAAKTMRVSIIIPVYNEFRTFEQVLERVRRAPLPAGCEKEIVVVDDGSTDGTAQIFGDHAPVPARLWATAGK